MASSLISRVGFGGASLLALCTACAAHPGRAAATAAPACAGSFTVRSAQDLRRAAACERIEGSLRIAGTSLESLEGLRSVRHVEGRLEVVDNPRLRSLAGLENVATVRTLVVSGNPALASVAALGRLAVVGGATFANNPRLASLHGLEGVCFASHVVVRNTGIANLAPLHDLHAVGALVIADNPRLVSLDGLDALEGARQIDIEGNPELGNVRALRRLTWLSTAPTFRDNGLVPERDVVRLQGMVATRGGQ